MGICTQGSEGNDAHDADARYPSMPAGYIAPMCTRYITPEQAEIERHWPIDLAASKAVVLVSRRHFQAEGDFVACSRPWPLFDSWNRPLWLRRNDLT